MQDQDKTRGPPLIDEAVELPQRIVESEVADTEHRQVDKALKELVKQIERAKREWESTVDSLPELICLVDDRGRIVRANRTVETWNLGRVVDVKGQEFHKLLHPDCANSSCYLNSFWKQAWEKTVQGQPAQYEAYDEILKRHVLLQIQPWKGWERETASGSIVVMVRDITERVAVERMRDDLTDMMVHDLRNPLSNIASSLGLMHDAIVGGDETLPMPQLLAVATRGCEQLFRLVDSVLDVRRLEVAEVELTRSPVNPRELAEEVAEQIQPSALSRKQSLEVRAAPGVPDVPADRGLLLRVLNNLVDNAIKHTPMAGHIELRVEQAGANVLFAISDDGPGIPPEYVDHIFDRFFRLETAADSKGRGLGLAFCKLAVEAHGGRIWVESKPGQGATFCFTLPMEAAGSISDERGEKSNES
jgi:signal transduction histidine kinase